MDSQLPGARWHPNHQLHQLPGRVQSSDERRGQRYRVHGTRCPDNGFHAAHRHQLVSGLGMVIGIDFMADEINRLGCVQLSYLVQLPSDIEALNEPSGPATEFTYLHAWTEVSIPCTGKIRLDPISGLFANEVRIPLATTPHTASAAPTNGSTDPCEAVLDFPNIVHPGPRRPAHHAALLRRGVARDLRDRPARLPTADRRREADSRLGEHPPEQGPQRVDDGRQKPV